MNGMNENEQHFQIARTAQNDVELVCIDVTSVLVKFGGPGIPRTVTRTVPSTVPICLHSILIFGDKIGTVLGTVLVTVLGMPGPPNLARTLVTSIQTDSTSFWAVSGNLKILFIFVHSVHFMNQGPIFGLPMT